MARKKNRKTEARDAAPAGERDRPDTEEAPENVRPAENEGGEREEERPIPAGGGENAEIEELRRRVEELNERWLRAAADLDNFRKRTAREREKERERFRSFLILPFLDVADDLERALAGGETAGGEEFRRGVEMIHRKLLGVLGGQGVEPFRSVDEPFDPERHEAFQTVHDPEREAGVVAAEIRKGYRMGDRVLRAAQVVVAAAPPEEKDGEKTEEKGTSE